MSAYPETLNEKVIKIGGGRGGGSIKIYCMKVESHLEAGRALIYTVPARSSIAVCRIFSQGVITPRSITLICLKRKKYTVHNLPRLSNNPSIFTCSYYTLIQPQQYSFQYRGRLL